MTEFNPSAIKKWLETKRMIPAKEFNLSEKIDKIEKDLAEVTEVKLWRAVVDVKENVKEFIRLLKESFKKGEENIPIKTAKIILNYNKIIDKLAGDKLI